MAEKPGSSIITEITFCDAAVPEFGTEFLCQPAQELLLLEVSWGKGALVKPQQLQRGCLDVYQWFHWCKSEPLHVGLSSHSHCSYPAQPLSDLPWYPSGAPTVPAHTGLWQGTAGQCWPYCWHNNSLHCCKVRYSTMWLCAHLSCSFLSRKSQIFSHQTTFLCHFHTQLTRKHLYICFHRLTEGEPPISLFPCCSPPSSIERLLSVSEALFS